MDQLSVALDALRTAVEGQHAENTALKAQNDDLTAQNQDLAAQLVQAQAENQAIADAAGKVAALTEEISSPPAP